MTDGRGALAPIRGVNAAVLDRRRLLLALPFLVPVLMKLVVATGIGDYGSDGYYYAGIARHVQEGHGLVTQASTFHHGYESFPHPSPVYPLWPLLLGWTARITGLEVAAVWLPTLLYFAAVAFAWLWARGLPRVPLFERWPGGPDTAHATAWLLAWNAVFFDKTSRPYTEAFAFALLLVCLWRAPKLWARREWIAGAELGAWMGFVFLARSQLVLLAMAAACAFGWALVAIPGRVRTLAMALSCAAVAATVVAPQYLRLREISVRPATAMLRFEMAQANDVLAPVHVLADTQGAAATVADRLRGIPVAFSPLHDLAYMRAFFGLQYALLVAVPLALVLAWRTRRRLGSSAALAWLRDPARLPLVFVGLFAAGGLVSLHLVHKDFGTEWHFGRRHALTAFFAFQLAWLFLLHRGGARVRTFALVLLAGSMLGGFTQMWRLSARSLLGLKDLPARADLVRFLEEHRGPDGTLTVAMNGGEAQRMAFRMHGTLGVHWLHLGTPIDDLEKMVDVLGVRFLLLKSDPPEDWAFLSDRARFDARFTPVAELDGYEVYAARSDAPYADAASACAKAATTCGRVRK